MKMLYNTRSMALSAGILLVLPSLYFIVSAVLNQGFGFPLLWKFIKPTFENPAYKNLTFKINLLILFGPLAAVLVNLLHLVRLYFFESANEVYVYMIISNSKYNWLLIAAGTLCSAMIILGKDRYFANLLTL